MSGRKEKARRRELKKQGYDKKVIKSNEAMRRAERMARLKKEYEERKTDGSGAVAAAAVAAALAGD
jgi:hypothetical protein